VPSNAAQCSALEGECDEFCTGALGYVLDFRSVWRWEEVPAPNRTHPIAFNERLDTVSGALQPTAKSVELAVFFGRECTLHLEKFGKKADVNGAVSID